MKISKQKIEEYSQYKYKGSVSYSDGDVFIDVNYPWFMCYLEYTGDAVINVNTKDINISCTVLQNKLFFRQLEITNPKEKIFEYFGTLNITKAKVYGLGGSKAGLKIITPNLDQPELMDSNPETITRFPDKISKGNTFHIKNSLNVLTKLEAQKIKSARKSGIGAGRATKLSSKAQSSTTSGGSGY